MESATPREETGRGRALIQASAAALGLGVLWAILSAVFNFHVGLLVVAAFGGWLIGSLLRPTGSRRSAWAVGLAAAGWLIGALLDFVLAQAALPGSSIPLAERLTVARFLDYVAGTFDVIQALAIAILLIVAWRSAR